MRKTADTRMGIRHPIKSLLGRSAGVPVADIVGGSTLLVRTLGPQVILLLVMLAGIFVLQRFAPVIDRDFRRLKIRTVPRASLVARRGNERLQTFARRGKVA